MLGGAGVSDYVITTGAGADIIQLNANAAQAHHGAGQHVVTDFTRGDAGDKFEMNSYLTTTLAGLTANADFFNSGHFRLLQSSGTCCSRWTATARARPTASSRLFALAKPIPGRVHRLQLRRLPGGLHHRRLRRQ